MAFIQSIFKSTVILFFFSALTFQAHARDWVRVKVPGAKCGNGSAYSIFVSKGQSDKLVAEFMGGGACWSTSTCYGPNLRTWMYPVPELPAFSVLTGNSARNPLRDHTMVYFPYCTGDVHAGQHMAEYGWGIETHHTGYNNVLNALEYLSRSEIIEFQKLKEIVVWGVSAGAIGSLIHTVNFDKYLPEDTKRVIIADSPGLHFGKTFWDKFPSETMNDFKYAFGQIHLDIDVHDGFVARRIGPVFKRLSNWNIGILQSTHDIIMSTVFGDISRDEHAEQILSFQGLSSVRQSQHVKTWIPHTAMHTFLLEENIANKFVDPKGETAFDFFLRVYNGQ